MIRKLIEAILFIVMLAVMVTFMSVVAAQAEGQRLRTPIANPFKESAQQPLYTDYRGVLIGMTAGEARAKLGEAALKADDQDVYVVSASETAQIEYDAAHKVVGISVDYMGGTGAPDYRNVVGGDALVKPDGAIYKMVRYEQIGIWVSYNRTPGSVPIVTITIHKIVSFGR